MARALSHRQRRESIAEQLRVTGRGTIAVELVVETVYRQANVVQLIEQAFLEGKRVVEVRIADAPAEVEEYRDFDGQGAAVSGVFKHREFAGNSIFEQC